MFCLPRAIVGINVTKMVITNVIEKGKTEIQIIIKSLGLREGEKVNKMDDSYISWSKCHMYFEFSLG